MAKEKVVKLEIDSNVEDVTKDFTKLDKEVNKTTSSIDELDTKLSKLNNTNKKLEKSTSDYNKKATKGYKKTNQEVSKLDKNLKKSNEGFKAGSEVIGFVGDSMSLVGVESEALESSLKGVDEAMRLGKGVDGLLKASGTIKELGLMAKVSAGLQYLLTTAIGGTSGALKIFRLALISTGVGAIVVAIGMLVANFDKLSGAMTGGIDGFKKMGVGAKLLMLPLLPLITTIELVKKGLLALGLMEEEEDEEKQARHDADMKRIADERAERERSFKARQQQFDREIAMQDALGNSTFELRQQKLKDLIVDQKLLLASKDAVLNTLEELRLMNDSLEIRKEINDAKQRFFDAEQKIADAENQIAINTHKNNEDIVDSEEDKTNKYIEYAENRLDAQRELIDRQLNAEMLALETEKTLLEAHGKDLTLINQQIFDKELEQEKVNWQREYDDVLKNEDLTRKEKNAIREAMELEWTATEKQMRSERDAEEIEEAREQAKKLAEIEEARQDNLLQLEMDYYARLEKVDNEYFDSQKTAQALEIQAVRDKYYTIEQEAIANGDSIVNIVALREQQIAEIEGKYREEKRQADLKAIGDNFDMAKQSTDALQNLGDLVFSQKMSKLEKGSKEEEELARKQFKFNKALQLSGAVIDAGKAVVASLASAPLAIGVVPNPVGIASLALTALTSATNIAKIASTKFSSNQTSPNAPSGNVGGGGDVVSPEFNIVGGAELNDLEGVGQQPLQAYVVSGDVTSAQSLDRNRVENATI